MKKTDIIQRIAFVNVPNNAKLVERTHPPFAGTGVVVSSFTPGNIGGMRIMMARLLCQVLEGHTADLGDTPDATLLRRLHEACIKNTELTIKATVIKVVEGELVNDHRKMVGQIVEVANELGLEYERPKDPFLE